MLKVLAHRYFPEWRCVVYLKACPQWLALYGMSPALSPERLRDIRGAAASPPERPGVLGVTAAGERRRCFRNHGGVPTARLQARPDRLGAFSVSKRSDRAKAAGEPWSGHLTDAGSRS